jgi:uncharacterized membrane protein (DUF2068 family)
VPGPRPYLARLWEDLGRRGEAQDTLIRLIIVERITKAVLLVLAAIALVVLGRTGLLYGWALDARRDLLLAADANLVFRLLNQLLVWVGFYQHQTTLALAVALYALVEGAEGVGLAMRRRWAEYLIVVATGFLIPWEVYEVISSVTPLKVGGLLLNIAVVAYLAWRKRLFVGI